MKRFAILITIAITSLTASSQTVTQAIKSIDTTVVTLPKGVAKEVIKDLIKADSLRSEYDYLKKNYSLLESSLRLKDTIIVGKDSVIMYLRVVEQGYKKIIALEEQQTLSYRVVAETLQTNLKDEKKKRLKTTLSLSIVSIVGILFLLK